MTINLKKYRWVLFPIILNLSIILLASILPLNIININLLPFNIDLKFLMEQEQLYFSSFIAIFGIYMTVLSIVSSLPKEINFSNAIRILRSDINLEFILFLIINLIISVILSLRLNFHFRNMFMFSSLIMMILYSILMPFKIFKISTFRFNFSKILEEIEFSLKNSKSQKFENEHFKTRLLGFEYIITTDLELNKQKKPETEKNIETISETLSDINPSYGYEDPYLEKYFFNLKKGSLIKINKSLINALNKYKNYIKEIIINTYQSKNDFTPSVVITYKQNFNPKKIENLIKENIKEKDLISSPDLDRLIELINFSKNKTTYCKFIFNKFSKLFEKLSNSGRIIFLIKLQEILKHVYLESNKIELLNKHLMTFLYKITYDYNSLDISLEIQHLLFERTKDQIKNNIKNGFLLTVGLYFNELIKMHQKDFTKSKDIEFLKKFNQLSHNCIKKQYLISKMFIENNYERKFIKNQIESQIKNFEYYYEDVYSYNSNYNNLIDKEKKIIDTKVKIINEINKKIRESVIAILFLILMNIEKGDLENKFFDFAEQIKNMNMPEYFADENDFLEFISLEENINTRGAQFINQNFDKYKILMIINDFINQDCSIKNLNIDKYEKDYLHNELPFEEELNKINITFIKKYFDISKKDLSKFKQKFLEELKEIKQKKAKEKLDKIDRAQLDDKLISNFKKDVLETREKYDWFKNNLPKKNIIYRLDKNPKDKPKLGFGIFELFFKDYFIQGSNWAHTLGKDKGRGIGVKKTSEIKKILIEKAKKIKTDNIEKELNKIIKKGKNYFFFTNNINLINKLNVKYDQEGNRFIKIKRKKIYLESMPNNKNLLIEDDAFDLVQYNAFKDSHQEVYISVEELSTEDKKKITKKNKELNNDKLKNYIKIKVLEKFRLENVDKNKIFVLFNELTEKQLIDKYEKQTGKHAKWGGKITKQYNKWKKNFKN